jgi:hypothetical protein
MPIILATQEAEIRRIMVQSQPRQIIQETLAQKKTQYKKRAGGMAQVIGCLNSKCEVLSSNSRTTKYI